MKRVVHAVLKAGGYRLNKIDPDAIEGVDELLGSFLGALQKAGFSPRHILDVGANHGLWTRQAMVIFPDAQYTLVEPQDELKREIDDLVRSGRKIEWINAAASDRAGTMAFTITHRDDSSTLSMSAQEARAAGLKQVPMIVRTLNEIVSASGKGCPEMVKIDAEGFDLKVLAGATELWGKDGSDFGRGSGVLWLREIGGAGRGVHEPSGLPADGYYGAEPQPEVRSAAAVPDGAGRM